SIDRLVSQGIGVYFVDNWSTDTTLEKARGFEGRGLIGWEQFPSSGPTGLFTLRTLLQRTEELALEISARWTIHHDVDELRTSPWPGVGLREGLERVQREGYNCVNHYCLTFRPTHEEFEPGDDFGEHFRYFEYPSNPNHFRQIKAWQHHGRVCLSET